MRRWRGRSFASPGASAVAELVLSHAEQEPQPGVFEALEAALDRLTEVGGDNLAGSVLASLWTITEAFGFAPQIDACVRCGSSLRSDEMARFDFGAGGVRCSACAVDSAGPRVGPAARRQLAALLEGTVPEDMTHPRRHLTLVSDFIAYHVVAKPLKSLGFLGGVMPPDAEIPVA